MIAIEKTCAVKALQRHEAIMRRNFQTLIREESKSPGVFKNEIRELKEKLEVLDQERYHGALMRARAEKFAVGEFPTKKALGMEKRYARKNTISEIEKDGKIMKDQTDIEHAFFEYYSKLFAHSPVKVTEFMEEFLVLLPKLNEETKEFLDMPTTVTEIVKAIDELSPGKTAGPDGIGAAFYNTFRDEVAPVLHNLFNEVY